MRFFNWIVSLYSTGWRAANRQWLIGAVLATISIAVTIWNWITPLSPRTDTAYSYFCFVVASLAAYHAYSQGRNAFRAVLTVVLLCIGLDLGLGLAMILGSLPTRPLLTFQSTLPGPFPPEFLIALAGILLIGCLAATALGTTAAFVVRRSRITS